MKKIIFALILCLLFLIACSQQESMVEQDSMMQDDSMMDEEMTEKEMMETAAKVEEQMQEQMQDKVSDQMDWKNIMIKDVKTQESFKISDFKGKKIILESFAVWCPICTKQQNEIKKLHNELGDSVVSISLDTDPNEDESRVLAHINEYGFDWYYAVSPAELTQGLIEDFGVGVVNAPSAPVILVCEDQSSRLLPRGVKNLNELKSELNKGC